MFTKPDYETVKRQAASRHNHAKGCKASPDTCKVCKDNRAWFDSLPLDTLARVLADDSNAHTSR